MTLNKRLQKIFDNAEKVVFDNDDKLVFFSTLPS